MLRAVARETHSGLVLLVGDRAYKIKKPIRTAYLDFSTPQRRRAALRRELELNRRLAPHAYLGIGRFTDPTDDAPPSEPVLLMRRMPDDRRLSGLVRAGVDVRADLRAVARTLVAFHTRAERSAAIDADGTPAALAARWTANLAELDRALPVEQVHEVADLVDRFLAGRGPLLDDRVARGRIVDGHGDLLADDVFCVPEGPQLLDCLDFDDHLRHVDVLDDAAFLAMDLEHLGRRDLAEAFLADYVEFSGDPAPPALRHHYVAYRAGVRAKVACLRHDQGDPAAESDVLDHVRLALGHLHAAEVRLALVGGLPGTGKTTLAGGLADRAGAVLLSSDRIRKELAGVDPDNGAAAPFRSGLYTPDRVAAVYAELLKRAEQLLGHGESVVLDASWTSADHRAGAADVAERTRARLVPLQCCADADTAARRIAARTAGMSDATVAVAAAMAAEADPWPDAVRVPTSGPVAEAVEHAVLAWESGTKVPSPPGPNGLGERSARG